MLSMYLMQVATDVVTTPAVLVPDPSIGQKLFAFVQPYLQLLVEAIIGAAAAWIAAMVSKWTGKNMEAKDRESLQVALTNAVGLLIQKAGSLASTMVDLHLKTSNPHVKEAIDYVLKAAPDAVANFKLTPAAIAEKLEAKLGQMTPIGNSGQMPVAPARV